MIENIGSEGYYSQVTIPILEPIRKWVDWACFCLHPVVLVVITATSEPFSVLKSVFDTVRGYLFSVSSWGANPTALDTKRGSRAATLLIHGNMSNDSCWIPLLDRIQSNWQMGPIYTVNLPAGRVTEEDHQIVESRLAEIWHQYATQGQYDVNIHLVGYSRGVDILNRCIERGLPPRIRPVSVTVVGTSLKKSVIDWLSTWSIPSKEILAGRDIIVPRFSWPLPDRRILVHDSGHVGLLHHRVVQNEILRRIV